MGSSRRTGGRIRLRDVTHSDVVDESRSPEAAPDITSGATATAINENSGAGQVVYTATSTDAGDTATGSTTYSLKAATGDVAAFSINASINVPFCHMALGLRQRKA